MHPRRRAFNGRPTFPHGEPVRPLPKPRIPIYLKLLAVLRDKVLRDRRNYVSQDNLRHYI